MFPGSVESFHTVRKVSSRVKSFRTVLGIFLFSVGESNILVIFWCRAFHAMSSNLTGGSCDTPREVAILSERVCDLMRGCAILREESHYQIGWIFGKKSKRPFNPPPFFGKLCCFFCNGYGCIYARRYGGQIVWNACKWFPEIGTILIFLDTIVEKNICTL